MKFNFKYCLFTILVMSFSWGFAQGKMQLNGGSIKQKTKFEFHNNIIILPVEINGISLNFILDTGASKTIIFTLEDSDSLVLNNTKIVELRGLGLGEPIEAMISENNQIKLGNIIGYNQTIYMVFDEHFDFSSKMGKTIHGIIGYDLLKDFVVTLNFNDKSIIFKNPEEFKPPKSKKFEKLDLSFHNNKPYIESYITIKDTTTYFSKMLIDTGNSDALWVFEDEQKGITTPTPFFRDHLGEGLSGSIEGNRTKIKSFQFGSFTFSNPTVAFLDSTSTTYARIYEERNGSIGTQILNRFKMILDYPNKQIYFKKNRSFNLEFKYNRSGIELSHFGKTLVQKQKITTDIPYSKGESTNNRTIEFLVDYMYEFKPIYGIYKIRKNSPAEIAGLKVNDILNKVNGKNAYEFELEEINAIFSGDIDKNISLHVERNGIILYYEFRLKDLL